MEGAGFQALQQPATSIQLRCFSFSYVELSSCPSLCTVSAPLMLSVCVHAHAHAWMPACLHGCTSDTRPVNKAPFIVPFRPPRSPSWRHCGWGREWRHRRATIVTLFGVGTTTPRFSEEWLVAPAPKEKRKKAMHECGASLWYKCLETK